MLFKPRRQPRQMNGNIQLIVFDVFVRWKKGERENVSERESGKFCVNHDDNL